MIGAANLVELD